MEQTEEYLDLRQLWAVMMKRWWILLLIPIVALLASAAYSYVWVTPTYEATAEVLVNRSEEAEIPYNINDINTDLKLIETYTVVMKSPRIVDLVIEEMGLNLTTPQLISKISVSPVQNSQVMAVTVRDANQERAAKIVNTLTNVFQREIVNIMNVDNVQVLTPAEVAESPASVSPKPLLNMAIAVVVGLMVAVGIVFLLEYLDTTIRSEEEVALLLDLPVLGSIAWIEEDVTGSEIKKGHKKEDEPTGEGEERPGETFGSSSVIREKKNKGAVEHGA